MLSMGMKLAESPADLTIAQTEFLRVVGSPPETVDFEEEPQGDTLRQKVEERRRIQGGDSR